MTYNKNIFMQVYIVCPTLKQDGLALVRWRWRKRQTCLVRQNEQGNFTKNIDV